MILITINSSLSENQIERTMSQNGFTIKTSDSNCLNSKCHVYFNITNDNDGINTLNVSLISKTIPFKMISSYETQNYEIIIENTTCYENVTYINGSIKKYCITNNITEKYYYDDWKNIEELSFAKGFMKGVYKSSVTFKNKETKLFRGDFNNILFLIHKYDISFLDPYINSSYYLANFSLDEATKSNYTGTINDKNISYITGQTSSYIMLDDFEDGTITENITTHSEVKDPIIENLGYLSIPTSAEIVSSTIENESFIFFNSSLIDGSLINYNINISKIHYYLTRYVLGESMAGIKIVDSKQITCHLTDTGTTDKRMFALGVGGDCATGNNIWTDLKKSISGGTISGDWRNITISYNSITNNITLKEDSIGTKQYNLDSFDTTKGVYAVIGATSRKGNIGSVVSASLRIYDIKYSTQNNNNNKNNYSIYRSIDMASSRNVSFFTPTFTIEGEVGNVEINISFNNGSDFITNVSSDTKYFWNYPENNVLEYNIKVYNGSLIKDFSIVQNIINVTKTYLENNKEIINSTTEETLDLEIVCKEYSGTRVNTTVEWYKNGINQTNYYRGKSSNLNSIGSGGYTTFYDSYNFKDTSSTNIIYARSKCVYGTNAISNWYYTQNITILDNISISNLSINLIKPHLYDLINLSVLINSNSTKNELLIIAEISDDEGNKNNYTMSYNSIKNNKYSYNLTYNYTKIGEHSFKIYANNSVDSNSTNRDFTQTSIQTFNITAHNLIIVANERPESREKNIGLFHNDSGNKYLIEIKGEWEEKAINFTWITLPNGSKYNQQFNITLNDSYTQLNPLLLNITTSINSTIDNGTYYGNITFKVLNAPINNQTTIFKYYITPPSGIPIAYNVQTGIKCDVTNCDYYEATGYQTALSITHEINISNEGKYDLSDVNLILNGFPEGYDIFYPDNGLTIEINKSVIMSFVINNPPASETYIHGWIDVNASADIVNHRTNLDSQSGLIDFWLHIYDNSNTVIVVGGGGGGGSVSDEGSIISEDCKINITPNNLTITKSRQVYMLKIINFGNESFTPKVSLSGKQEDISIGSVDSIILPNQEGRINILSIDPENDVTKTAFLNIDDGICEGLTIPIIISKETTPLKNFLDNIKENGIKSFLTDKYLFLPNFIFLIIFVIISFLVSINSDVVNWQKILIGSFTFSLLTIILLSLGIGLV